MTTLEREATIKGRCWQSTVQRGDISAQDAFHASGVGYPYMTAAEYDLAFKAFQRALGKAANERR